MSAFAKSTFNASAYLAYRPTYPPPLLDYIRSYHQGGYDTLMDIGCGQGQIATALAPHFDRVLGVDPSAKMTSAALQAKTRTGKPVEYRNASCEDLPFLGQEVDLVTAGQAAHWFKMDSFWKEMERVVKPSGTVALIGYGDPYFKDSEMTRIIRRLSKETLGKYWEQPGRSLVDVLYRTLPGPKDSSRWSSFERLDSNSLESIAMSKDLTLTNLESYIRTWSAVATAKEEQPGDDPVGSTFTELRTRVDPDTPITVHWPVGLILARRAQ